MFVNSPTDGSAAFLPFPELIAQCARGEVGMARDRVERFLSDHPRHPVATLALKLIAEAPSYAVISEIAASELKGNALGPDELERLGNRLSACEGMSEVATAALEAAGEMDYLASGTVDPFGGPFNGQMNRKALFDDIIAKTEIEAIVETGTYRASTTEYMARATGLPVFSCEIDRRLFAYCRRRLEALPNAVVSPQDSPIFLKSVISDDRLRQRRVFFYLDAHWYENLPLKEEIRIILHSDVDPVIMIDDFAVPGDPQYGFDDYGPSRALSTQYLLQFACSDLPLFFPSLPADRETGSKRGCVVFCRPPTDKLLEARVEGLFRVSWRDAILAHLYERQDAAAKSAIGTSLHSEKDSEISTLTVQRQQLTDQLNKLTRDNEEARLRIGEKDSEIAILTGQRQQLTDQLNKLTRDNEEAQLRIEEKDSEIATLIGLRQQQADLLNNLTYDNERLQQQVQELRASRWRKLVRWLRLAKVASSRNDARG
jgi:hypothetical protein